MRFLRLAACAAMVSAGAQGCHKEHPTSVAETSIAGTWLATAVHPPLTINFIMIIESDDERQLVIDILGQAGGVEQRGTGTGTLNGSAVSFRVTSPGFFYSDTGTFTGTRVSLSRLEGQIVYDVVTNLAPMTVTFDKRPLKHQ